MLTDYQRQLFSELVNVNYEADNTSNPPLLRDIARNQYWELQAELMEDMGVEEYNRFISRGRQLFS